jgi:hypothetical protein
MAPKLISHVGIEALTRMLAKVLSVYSDCSLIRAEKPVFLMVKPRAVTALRIRWESLHLSEALQEIDESLGVVFGDCSNLRWRRPNRPLSVLPEMAAADG